MLTAANTYTGGTTVSGGTLALGNAGALGSTSGALTVSGGTLDFGANAVTTRAVSLTGGTIQNGTLTGSSYATSSGTLSAVLAGSVSLTQNGSGTTRALRRTNTYTGGLTVNAGTLVANAANQATGAAGNGNITVNSGGTISVTGDNALWGYAPGTTHTLQINAGGLVTTGGNTGHLSALVMNGGTLSATTANANYGNWDLDGGVSTLGNGSTSAISGGNVALTQTGGTTFNIGSGDTLNVSSVVAHVAGISTDTGIIKGGAGTLTFSGNNTYTGATTINAGTLQIGAGGASGTTGVLGAENTTGRTVTVNSGATLSLASNNVTDNGSSSPANIPTLVVNGVTQ